MNTRTRSRTLVPLLLFSLAGIAPSRHGSASAAEPSEAAITPAGDQRIRTHAEATPPDLPDGGLHPDLVAIDGWLQADITSLEELEGQIVAVQFWTFDCSNWLATLDHMKELYAHYHDQGFEIVGIHSPEFDYEAIPDNVATAAERLGVTWPIALDTSKRTFHAWQDGSTSYWPRIYLLDRAGHIRYDHIGEGRYHEIDAAVRALLAEPS